MLSSISFCEPVENEHQLDLITATVGVGPAYPARMASAMIAFLVDSGVDSQVASRATEGMLTGAARPLAGKTAEASKMVQRFIDCEGTTAAGLQTAMSLCFEQALKEGFQAGTRRAEQMARGVLTCPRCNGSHVEFIRP